MSGRMGSNPKPNPNPCSGQDITHCIKTHNCGGKIMWILHQQKDLFLEHPSLPTMIIDHQIVVLFTKESLDADKYILYEISHH